MKKNLFITLIFLAVPCFALISPDLEQVMNRATPSDYLPVNIVFKKQMDVNLLTSMVRHLPKPERRARVAEILQKFSQDNQEEIRSYLKQKQTEGKVQNIVSLWVLNAI